MKMEMVKKNSEGEVQEKRGRRRVVIDGVLKNQSINEETLEWEDFSAEE